MAYVLIEPINVVEMKIFDSKTLEIGGKKFVRAIHLG